MFGSNKIINKKMLFLNLKFRVVRYKTKLLKTLECKIKNCTLKTYKKY